jgi:hypothetical protein
MSTIYFVGGCKGGVGKSLVAGGLINYLQSKNKVVGLAEADNSNPDVGYAHQGQIPMATLDLDKKEGWLDLITFCDENKGAEIVVNTGARNEEGMKAFHKIFNDTMAQEKNDIVMFWVINTNSDSVNLANNFMDIMPDVKLHIVKNGFFGEPSDFDIYDTSEAKKKIEAAGGKDGFVYKLANRVNTLYYNKSKSIKTIRETLPTLGDKAELFQFTNGLELMFNNMIGSK